MTAAPTARSLRRRAAGPGIDAEAVLVAVGEAAYRWSIASDRIAWSANAAEVLGVDDPARWSTGARYAELVDPEALTTRASAVLASTGADEGGGVPYDIEYPLRPGKGARPAWAQDTGRWFAGPDGRPERALGIVRALGGRHEGSQRAALLARFDPLTGQMSRPRLLEIAEAALAEAVRLRSSCAIALVSIANLSEINDAYGLDIGDEVIAGVSLRLRAAMRGGDALGRFSSSAFGLVLRSCTKSDLLAAGRRFLDAVHGAPIVTAGGQVPARLAIGGVIAPRSARTVDEMVLHARDALNETKRARGVPLEVYSADSPREVARRGNLRLGDDLVVALNERRVHLALQPVVHSATGRIAWKEALLRIERPDGTLISGGPLIRAAEHLGLASLVDHRVLELAMQLLASDPAAAIAINVSAATTGDAGWLEALASRLKFAPDAGQRLHVEITETAAIADLDMTRAFVAQLKAFGVRVAIDDFGAGHTSFKALRHLGVDAVKIDGSFISDLDRSPDSVAFVRALVALARELGLDSVAEQVETESAAAKLASFGVSYLQGALFGAPTIEAADAAASAG